MTDEKSVTSQELYYAASATSYAASAAASAVTSTPIAHVVHVVHAAYSAAHAAHSVVYISNAVNTAYYIEDMILYLQALLRTTKQYNTKIHNNQHYEFILKEIINEDIDKLTDTDYNMLIDLSQEYYNINPNITNKRILVELLRREYE